MNKRRTSISTIAVLSLLLVAFVSVSHASYSTSIIYSKFNSTSISYEQLDKNYTSLTIDVKVYLTFGNGEYGTLLFANATGTFKSIKLLFMNNYNDLNVWYSDGATEVNVASGTYAKGNTTRLILANGKVTVYSKYQNSTTRTKILDNFSFSGSIRYLGAVGTNTTVASNGYVQVDVNVGISGTAGSTNESIMMWIPTIVTFAMIGMIMGLMKKMGKW